MDIRYSSYPLQYICYDSDHNLIRDHPISFTIAIAKHLFLRSWVFTQCAHPQFLSTKVCFLFFYCTNTQQLPPTEVHSPLFEMPSFSVRITVSVLPIKARGRPAYISRYSLSCSLPCTWFIHSSSLTFPFLRPLRALRAWYWWCPILILMLSLNSGLCKHCIPNLSQPSAQHQYNPLLEIEDFRVFQNHLSEENSSPASVLRKYKFLKDLTFGLLFSHITLEDTYSSS